VDCTRTLDRKNIIDTGEDVISHTELQGPSKNIQQHPSRLRQRGSHEASTLKCYTRMGYFLQGLQVVTLTKALEPVPIVIVIEVGKLLNVE